MNLSIAFLLAMTFLISVGGLALLIWALANDQFGMGHHAAETIFAPGEVGVVEDPATPIAAQRAMQQQRGDHRPESSDELQERTVADRSSRTPVLFWLSSSMIWLLLGSIFGVIASVKLHLPDWLVTEAALTFGRVRPAHLNVVAYGWASMAGVGVGLWLIPRLFKTALVGGGYAIAGALIWNLGLLAGTEAILSGRSDGQEWLEFPWAVDIALVIGGALAAVPLILTLLAMRVGHRGTARTRPDLARRAGRNADRKPGLAAGRGFRAARRSGPAQQQ
jgi:cytochrome c oxidase cbb3-type subunit 1